MAPPRVPTHVGDRNEDRSVKLKAPRGVGLTEPPTVPKGEFNFESKTPVGTEPHIWRALREFQKQNQGENEAIKLDVQELREGHIEVKTKLDTIIAFATKTDEAAERRRKYIVPIITAVGIAIAGIIAAALHGCF